MGPSPSHIAQALPWHRGLGRAEQPSWEPPRSPVRPSGGHLDQPAQTCSENATKSRSSKPLWKVGSPFVSLSLNLPGGKEFCDLEGHTIPPNLCGETQDKGDTNPRAGAQKAPRASTHCQPLGKEKMPQQIRLARILFTWQAGEGADPVEREAEGMGCSRKGPSPQPPKVSVHSTGWGADGDSNTE